MTNLKLTAIIVAFIGLAVAAAVVGHAKQEALEQTMAATPLSAAPTGYVEAATGVTWAIRGASSSGYYSGSATATCPAGTTVQAQFKRSWCCYEWGIIFDPTYKDLSPGDCTGQASCTATGPQWGCGYDCDSTQKVLILCTK